MKLARQCASGRPGMSARAFHALLLRIDEM
jgi:hypothetical protein